MSGSIQSEGGDGITSETGVQLLAEGAGSTTPSGPPVPPTFHYFAPPPTRILSWTQMVMEVDPEWRAKSLRPWVYEFSNGRLFVQPNPVYGSTGITDDFGTPITDDFGNQIQSDEAGGAAPGQPGGFPFGEGAFGQTGF